MKFLENEITFKTLHDKINLCSQQSKGNSDTCWESHKTTVNIATLVTFFWSLPMKVARKTEWTYVFSLPGWFLISNVPLLHTQLSLSGVRGGSYGVDPGVSQSKCQISWPLWLVQRWVYDLNWSNQNKCQEFKGEYWNKYSHTFQVGLSQISCSPRTIGSHLAPTRRVTSLKIKSTETKYSPAVKGGKPESNWWDCSNLSIFYL